MFAVWKKERQLESQQGSSGRRALQSAAIATYVHVITSGSAGAVSNTTIIRQIAQLNKSFGPHKFAFTLAGITR